MFENFVLELKTKHGLIKMGDLGVITNNKKETFIAHFDWLFGEASKIAIRCAVFYPTINKVDRKEFSLEEFEKTTIKFGIIGSIRRSKSCWGDFVKQYENNTLIQKAERLRQYHLVS